MRQRLLWAFSFNDYPCPQAAIHPVTSSALGALSGPSASYPQPDNHLCWPTSSISITLHCPSSVLLPQGSLHLK